MSIRWDSLLARHTAHELSQLLTGARLRALRFDGRARDMVLFFRDRTLLWRLHPDRGFPLLSEAIEPEEGDLRLKARVRRVYAPTDERIIVFELLSERRGRGHVDLVVELLGNQLNALVTEGVDRTIRHLLRRREGRRPARVGSPYLAPPATGRIGAKGDLPLERWHEILASSAPEDRARELVRRVAWMSPLNVGAFLAPFRQGTEDSLTRESLRHGYEAWLAAATETTPVDPVVLETERGPQPYPFPLLGVTLRHVGTLIDAFAACAEQSALGGDVMPALALAPELMASFQDAVKHVERRVVRLTAELDGLEDAGALRAIGDLILARYAEIPSGASSTTLLDFSGEEVTVELDPTLAPHQNASRNYDRAARSERALRRLPGLITEACAKRDRMRTLLEGAGRGTVDAATLRAALPPGPLRRERTDAPPSLPYRTFRSSGGLEIRVGRGRRHNDDLTFRHSAPGDVWMHARHVAGAHVVLRWSKPGNPPARDLAEACALAALHSKARTSSSVPVDWTLRKYVRKPRGSAPGAVVPDRVKTVFVNPDPSLLESLADDDR